MHNRSTPDQDEGTMLIERKHPHAGFREDTAARMAREKREDSIWIGVCVAVVLACLGIFLWMSSGP